MPVTRTITIDEGHYTITKANRVTFVMTLEPDEDEAVEAIINGTPHEYLHFA